MRINWEKFSWIPAEDRNKIMLVKSAIISVWLVLHTLYIWF